MARRVLVCGKELPLSTPLCPLPLPCAAATWDLTPQLLNQALLSDGDSTGNWVMPLQNKAIWKMALWCAGTWSPAPRHSVSFIPRAFKASGPS